MADLDNLLDEINDVNGSSNDGHDQWPSYRYNGEEGINDGNVRSSDQAGIPTALIAAATTRLLLQEGEDYFGAGDERRDDDDNSSSNVLIAKADENDGNDSRKINPEYEQLKGLWTSELACPELLPHDADTVLNVEELTKQEDVIEDLLQLSKEQRQSSREGGASGEIASLVAQISKMDLDRTRFMLVDLARTRMAKIENHALHNRTLLDRMTEEERSYLRQYGELLEKHYRRTVLNQLPKEAWKKLDESEMIDSPDLEQFVFCHVLKTVQIDVTGEPNPLKKESSVNEEDDESEYVENVQEHRAGSYLITMYKSVRELVFEGKVELVM